jgi:hypothetical protein
VLFCAGVIRDLAGFDDGWGLGTAGQHLKPRLSRYGLVFTVSSTIVPTKTMRDDYKVQKLIKRLTNAKTEKMLQEYEIKP